LRGEIKRPDFLVGNPSIGTIAVDVKAKRVYRDALIIDAYEHRTLLNLTVCSWCCEACPRAGHGVWL